MPDDRKSAFVDLHAHWYPLECMEDAIAEQPEWQIVDGRGGKDLFWRDCYVMSMPAVSHDAAERVAEMDGAGVGVRVLSVGAFDVNLADARAPEVCERYNEELAAICAQAPDRFQWVAAVPITQPAAAAEVLDRAVARGAVGAGITTTVGGLALDDPALRDFWRDANRRKLLVVIHPTFPRHGPPGDRGQFLRVGYLGETAMAASLLVQAGVMDECPDLQLVWSHLGGTLPMLLDRLDRGYQRFGPALERPSAYLRRFYYDTVSTHAPALECARATFGASQLVFGTDDPHVPNGTKGVIEAVRARSWPADETEAIMGGTALRLLGAARVAGAV